MKKINSDLTSNPFIDLLYYSPASIVTRKLPRNIRSEDIWMLKHELSRTLEDRYIVQITNAMIKNGALYLPNSKTAPKSLYLNEISVNTESPILMETAPHGRTESITSSVSKGLWITDDWSGAYFHWITESLTPLIATSLYQSSWPVLLPSWLKSKQFVVESLSYLGYKYIFLPQGCITNVKKLISSSRTAPTGNYEPLVLSSLRSAFLKNSKAIMTSDLKDYKDKNLSTIVWITRLHQHFRCAINETQVNHFLCSQGVTVLAAERVSLHEQVKIFKSAKVIAGFHGAGLTNMLFMNPGSSVVEVRQPGDAENNCYFSMAAALQINYYYLFASSNSNEAQGLTIDQHALLQVMLDALHESKK